MCVNKTVILNTVVAVLLICTMGVGKGARWGQDTKARILVMKKIQPLIKEKTKA